MGFFERLFSGLTKSREAFVSDIDDIFSQYENFCVDFYEELEETLVLADVGITATQEIVVNLQKHIRDNNIRKPILSREYLIESLKEQMAVGESDYDFLREPSVVMVMGVNGVGKTTTVGKLARIYKDNGKKVLIAAADTFRAAATEQLEEWAKRADVDIIKAGEGADPGSVLYDATNAAVHRKVDVLICDTAGRLHNKKNLMSELEKLNRIVIKNCPGYRQENLIVLDATTGQNALMQAKEFAQIARLSGIVLTKMDGTAKGGIAIGIQSQLKIPVKYIGVGEAIEDLQEFDPDAFVNALFGVKKENKDVGA